MELFVHFFFILFSFVSIETSMPSYFTALLCRKFYQYAKFSPFWMHRSHFSINRSTSTSIRRAFIWCASYSPNFIILASIFLEVELLEWTIYKYTSAQTWLRRIYLAELDFLLLVFFFIYLFSWRVHSFHFFSLLVFFILS